MTQVTGKVEAALIELVRQAAKHEILPRFRALAPGEISAKTGPEDLVTVADLAAEAWVRNGLQAILPGAAFIGEESGLTPEARAEAAASELCVVLDPVDGTWNFAGGLAVFGTILAVLERGEIRFGLLYDPVLDDWIETRAGGGTWYCRPGAAPQRLVLGASAAAPSGFLPLALYPAAKRALIAPRMGQGGRVNSLRCSLHEYRQLLQGRADYIANSVLNVWDHAAGVLAVREAGGVVRLSDGSAYRPGLSRGHLLVARDEPAWAHVRALVDGPDETPEPVA